jgi:hypothetical protein
MLMLSDRVDDELLDAGRRRLLDLLLAEAFAGASGGVGACLWL